MSNIEGQARKQELLLQRAAAKRLRIAKVEEDGYLADGNGDPYACEENILVFARRLPAFGGVFYDTFRGRAMRDRDGQLGAITDDDASDLLLEFQRKLNPRAKPGQARWALKALCAERQRDPLREFIEGLPPWDGVARIRDAFADVLNAPDNEFTRAASGNLFIAMIARGMAKPPDGVKVDHCWILEGLQGIGKSQFLSIVGQPFHSEITAHIGHADFARQLRGTWIADMSELASLPRAGAETVKQVITATKDRGIPKYEEHAREYIRRCVFAAGTNRPDYLDDPTGGRRFIPIVCAAPFRLDVLMANREQLLAEARQLWVEGATWWELPRAEAEREQEDRRPRPLGRSAAPDHDHRAWVSFRLGELGRHHVSMAWSSAVTHAPSGLKETGWRDARARLRRGQGHARGSRMDPPQRDSTVVVA